MLLRIDPTKIVQPPWFIGDVQLSEPLTTITDLMIAAMSFYAWYRRGQSDRKGPQFTFFRLFFLLTGIGTVCGGIIGHGLIHVLDPMWKLIGFYLGMFAVAFIERSAIYHAKDLISPKLANFFLVLNMIELIFMMVYCAITLHFQYVEYHLAYGFLIVVLGFHTYVYYKTKDPGSKIMILNTGWLLFMVAIFNVPIIPHEMFNHRDLAHIIMCFSIWTLYQGALRMRTSEELRAYLLAAGQTSGITEAEVTPEADLLH